MRILANFSKKVSTGNYENESFSVTIECDTELTNVADLADYLFQEAHAAIDRQLGKTPAERKPAIQSPSALPAKNNGVLEALRGGNGGNGGGKNGSNHGKNSGAMTDAQRRYLFKLLAEQGIAEDEAHEALLQSFNVRAIKDATKAQASELIDRLAKAKAQVGA